MPPADGAAAVHLLNRAAAATRVATLPWTPWPVRDREPGATSRVELFGFNAKFSCLNAKHNLKVYTSSVSLRRL